MHEGLRLLWVQLQPRHTPSLVKTYRTIKLINEHLNAPNENPPEERQAAGDLKNLHNLWPSRTASETTFYAKNRFNQHHYEILLGTLYT